MKKSNKYLTIFLVSAILIVSFFAFRVFILRIGRGDVQVEHEDLSDSIVDYEEAQEGSVVPEGVIIEDSSEPEKEPLVELPEKILFDVLFLSQAPFGDWDERHEEACEEASLIMLFYYLSQKSLTPEIGESEIQRMIDFQIQNYGDFRDTSASETVELASDFYGMKNLEVIYDFEKDAIKKQLVQGNPVIVPAAGRMLENPFFTPPGPLYHNIILIGYDGDTIIAHDPGTRRGASFEYDLDVLYGAIHDFTGDKKSILSGRKAMIVVK